jgi:hypothetical protein
VRTQVLYREDKSRCSLCGAQRLGNGVVRMQPFARFGYGACSFIGCKNPSHDWEIEHEGMFTT